MRISDWSSDVCSSDLLPDVLVMQITFETFGGDQLRQHRTLALGRQLGFERDRFEPLLDPALLARFGHVHVLGTDGVGVHALEDLDDFTQRQAVIAAGQRAGVEHRRSEEHTSELQSLMRISYAVFCLKKKKKQTAN